MGSLSNGQLQELTSQDLELVLQLVRGGTLGEASRRLGLDTSSVYRRVKRLEQSLRLRLFERSKKGMAPTELALALAERGEVIEAQMLAARELVLHEDSQLTGVLCVSTTEILLSGLLMPVLPGFREAYPGLDLDIRLTNQRVRLDRREADVALRGTSFPPEHLVGANLGTLSSAVWGSRRYLDALPAGCPIDEMTWITPDGDELLTAYSKAWRTETYPKVQPSIRLDSLAAVAAAIEAGLGVGVLPYFLMESKQDIVDLTGRVAEVDFDTWLLTSPEMRYLRRVNVFFNYMKSSIKLPLPAAPRTSG